MKTSQVFSDKRQIWRSPFLEREERVLVLEAILETAVVDVVTETNPGTGLTCTHLGDAGIVAEPKGTRLLLSAGLSQGVVDVVKKAIGNGSLGTDDGGLGRVVTTTEETALILEIRLTHAVRGGVTDTDSGTGLFRNHRAARDIVGLSGLGKAENTKGEKSTSGSKFEGLGTGESESSHLFYLVGLIVCCQVIVTRNFAYAVLSATFLKFPNHQGL